MTIYLFLQIIKSYILKTTYYIKNKFNLLNICNNAVNTHGAQYKTFALFGVFNYPFSYFYQAYLAHHPELENFYLRLIATLLCLLLLFHEQWPNRFKKYLSLYWYLTLTFSISFFATILLLQNNFSLEWQMNFVLGIYILMLLVDWRSCIAIFTLGITLGTSFFCISYGDKNNIVHYSKLSSITLYMAICIFLIGIIFLRNKEKYQIASLEHKNKINRKLYSDIQSQSSKLKNALKTEHDFLKHITHEFRTPLHTINALSDNLLTQWQDIKEENKLDYVRLIYSDGIRLSELINNILDMNLFLSSKIKFNFMKTDLFGLIHTCIQNNIAFTISCKKDLKFNLQYSSNAPKFIYCDEVKIKQVINNLISNAIKYSQETGNIIIQVSLFMKNMIIIKIFDEGIGIPKGEEESIFKPFAQSANTKKMMQSKGLGLSIARSIIEGHFGKISAQNNANGVGTCVEIRLPIRMQQSLQENVVKSKNTSNVRPLIMCVDDELGVLQSLELLMHKTYDIMCFNSPHNALSFLETNYNEVSLILVDLMMPEMYGINFIKAVKENPFTKDIPMILNSCSSDYGEIRKAFDLCIDDFIQKPFTRDELLRKINSNLL